MGIVFRQSVKTTLTIFVGALLGALIIYISTLYIPKQELGFVRTLTNCSVVATQILLLGLQNTMSVYIHKYADNKGQRGFLIALCLVAPVIVMAISAALYWVFKTQVLGWFQPQDVPYISRYYMLLPVFTLLMMYQVVLEQYLISQVLVALSSFVREVVLRVVNVVLIVLFGLGLLSYSAFINGLVLAYAIPAGIFLFIAFRTKSFSFNLSPQSVSKAEVAELFRFTWYHFLLSISITLMGFLDTLMLVTLHKKGMASVAVYGNAVFFVSLLQMPYKAMYNATFPILAAAIKDADLLKVKDLFTRSSINILIGTCFMAILIIANLDSVVAIMPSGYAEVKWLVIILTIGNFIDMATGMNGQVLSISQFYRFNFYMSVVLVVLIIALNTMWIPHFGMYGAAAATAFSLILFNIAKWLYVWKKMDLQPFTFQSIKVMAAGVIALTAGLLLPLPHHEPGSSIVTVIPNVAMQSGAVVVVFLLLLHKWQPSPDVTAYINSIKEHKKLF
ncbi:MAG: hypothetical protein EBX41_08330 [Chitinophagia bacterium]|nr:hypothetical protein [Chitinophagia bacterium]